MTAFGTPDARSFHTHSEVRPVAEKLVTGSTGFMGSSIVRSSSRRRGGGVLVRKNSDTRNIDGLDVEEGRGDIRDGDSTPGAGGLRRSTLPRLLRALDARKKLPTRSTWAARARRCGRRSTPESTGWCTPTPTTPWARTAACRHKRRVQPLEDRRPLFHVKYLAEVEAKNSSTWAFGRHRQSTLVIGVRDIKPTPSGQMIIDIATGRCLVHRGGTNVVDVEDVARAHILAAGGGRVDERYLLGNENLTVSNISA